jgi:SnoaL-like domain
MTLAERLERLDAYRQIRQLAARYGRDLDARDMDALLGLYVPEIRERLLPVMVEPLRRVRITILHVGTHVIEFQDEDKATGSVYCHAEIQNTEQNWITQAIHYGDRYTRRDGCWYFARARRHELFYGADHGVRPNGLPAADWPTHDIGTGSVPMRWESWQEFWGSQAS